VCLPVYSKQPSAGWALLSHRSQAMVLWGSWLMQQSGGDSLRIHARSILSGRTWSKGENGAAVLEFVLIFPLLLLMAASVWEFGRVIDTQMAATNAAREGTRLATVSFPVSSSAVRDRTWNFLQASYGTRLGTVVGGKCSSGRDICINKADILVEFYDGSGNLTTSPQTGHEVRVTVPMKSRLFTTFIPGFSDPFTLTGKAVMRLP
jgi:Flp pilus assembly protein TadG